LDEESGLQYFEARYYDGVVGKFISVDPLYTDSRKLNSTKDSANSELGTPQRLALYSYSRNNPFKFIDLTGEMEGSFTELLQIGFRGAYNRGKATILKKLSKSTMVSGFLDKINKIQGTVENMKNYSDKLLEKNKNLSEVIKDIDKEDIDNEQKIKELEGIQKGIGNDIKELIKSELKVSIKDFTSAKKDFDAWKEAYETSQVVSDTFEDNNEP